MFFHEMLYSLRMISHYLHLSRWKKITTHLLIILLRHFLQLFVVPSLPPLNRGPMSNYPFIKGCRHVLRVQRTLDTLSDKGLSNIKPETSNMDLNVPVIPPITDPILTRVTRGKPSIIKPNLKYVLSISTSSIQDPHHVAKALRSLD